MFAELHYSVIFTSLNNFAYKLEASRVLCSLHIFQLVVPH